MKLFCLIQKEYINYMHYIHVFFITEISDSQATTQIASLEDISQNAWDDITDELSVDITDGASSPNQITSSVPSLTPEEE